MRILMHPVRRRSQEVDYLLVVEGDERGDSTNQDERNVVPYRDGVSVFKTHWSLTDKTIRVGTRTSIETIAANQKPLPSRVPRPRLVLGLVFAHQV